ncbi:hypothetical protein QYE76_047307 [Lolium multiflorum]|uniref:DUF5600 domain-containing protein n=1 Tax=Lolium multiflorum TaxID=4521 RepID=A0AAD8TRH3_LOLMU|nr:hypothetical protein QYE76_047307 [Lolium multiflorum]
MFREVSVLQLKPRNFATFLLADQRVCEACSLGECARAHHQPPEEGDAGADGEGQGAAEAEQFAKVQKEMHLPAGDFPSVDEYRDTLSAYNFDRFERLRPKMVQGVDDDMLAYDITDLLKQFRNPYQ